ncbi:Hypothetical predicted protein [Olea europaea subsp. europaea]|uniref:Uncharacterized protein n=1 Tax=Olea europaea subsp. europaea TaxID=158383 RepID=A0A8S0RZC4_OLEEU|nr:Hypothetical predicted protein [Olea europaea subsp. europaea]
MKTSIFPKIVPNYFNHSKTQREAKTLPTLSTPTLVGVESNFPRLRWLGITGSVNGDLVDALARSRPFLHVACRGEELGTDQWDGMDDVYVQDENVDFFEQWLLGVENESDDEMEDDVDLGELLE